MSDFRVPAPNVGERIYRALLHLYPRRFRRAFALDLLETFRDERRNAARREMPAAAFWLGALQDLVTQALAERLASTVRTLRPFMGSDREDPPMITLLHALRALQLRYAARRLARAPLFSVTTVLVLALGVGASTAMFGIVNGVLLRPLPFAQPERLVVLSHTSDIAGVGAMGQSDATVLHYQRQARAFDGVAAWRAQDVNFAIGNGAQRGAERLAAASVSANVLDVLGASPALGRGFRAGEDRASAARVAILSHALWQGQFAGDAGVLGRTVTVNGQPHVIVGVMGPRFGWPTPETRLWRPLEFDPARTNVGSFNFSALARLRAGVTTEAARADLARTLPRLLQDFPADIPPAMWAKVRLQPVVTPMKEWMIGDAGRLLWILLGSAGLVLLVACANVANLFLVRGESRQREVAVRGAIGAGLSGMIAQSLGEALVLATAGGVAGLALAAAGMGLATRFGASLGVPRLEQVTLDGPVALFALGTALFCAAAVSVVPALRARRLPIASVLRDAGRGATEGISRHAARNALVVAQVALALVLVAGSGLLARSFARLRNVKPGIEADGVTMARIALARADYPDLGATVRLYDRLLEQVRALPGVTEATLTTMVPLTRDHDDTVLGVEDHPLPEGAVARVHFVPTVDSAYFRTLRIPMLRGRTFGAQDPARGVREVVVSEAFARRYWGEASPLGRRLRPGMDSTWYTIVGVAGDVHHEALHTRAEDAVYFPIVTANRGTPRYIAILVRGAGAPGALTPEALAPALRRIVRSLDPSLPTFDERSLIEVVAAASARARVTLVLLAATSGIALLLGAIGLYGVMAYGVSLRRREIGVRLALGARPADVRGMISLQGIRLGAIGVTIGVACALGVTRLLAGLLYEVSPTDPLTLVGTCVALLAVSLAASWLPARRAAAMDPAVALRGE
jgi:predicted permease